MRALFLIAGLLASVATTWIVGSFVAGFVEPAGVVPASSIALAVGLLTSVGLPLLISFALVRALADRRPKTSGIVAGLLIVINTLLLGAAGGLAGPATQAALTQHGHWVLFGKDVPALFAGSVDVDEAPAEDAGVDDGESLPPEPPPSEPDPGPLDAKGVFAKAAGSVVIIEITSETEGPLAEFIGTTHGAGSGFAVAPTLIVTNYHVAGKATSMAVRTKSGQRVRARVLASIAADDLVLLGVPDVDLNPLLLAQAPIDVGSRTWAIGAPLGLEYSLTEGIISGQRDIAGTPFLQMQTTVAPGSSGGPLLDDRAHVVGVNTAVASPGLSLAVTAERVEALLALPRSEEAPLLPLLDKPITVVRVDTPDDMVPTDRQAVEELLNALIGQMSDVTLEEPTGRLELAHGGCRQEGLATDCPALKESLGFFVHILRMMPVESIGASFTDVPRTDGSKGDLEVVLYRDALPAPPETATHEEAAEPVE